MIMENNTTYDNEQMEQLFHNDLHRYLSSIKLVDERLPEAPDLEELWPKLAQSYMPDGVREFAAYPTASLGWMMYIGMALAKFWDAEWETYAKMPDLYTHMKDKRGYDCMDEYIREEVLSLKDADYAALEKLVGECASRVNNALHHQHIEPGTKEAFEAYVSCLHQLYLFGVAVQLNRMGYHMTEM